MALGYRRLMPLLHLRPGKTHDPFRRFTAFALHAITTSKKTAMKTTHFFTLIASAVRDKNMKTLTIALLFLTGAFTDTFAEQAKAEPARVQISISFTGVDAKWFSALEKMPSLRDDGSLACPSVTAKGGQRAIIELTQECRLDASTRKGPVIPCGIIVELTPEFDEHDIHITGATVLRYALNKSAFGVASRFAAEENLISMQLQDGATKKLDIGGGQMLITASLIYKSGARLKNEEVKQGVHVNTR